MPHSLPILKNAAWRKALAASADPARARHFLQDLANTSAAPVLKSASAEQARILAALFGGSPAMSGVLTAHPEYLQNLLDLEYISHPRRDQGFRREVNGWLPPLIQTAEYETALSKLREFKQREMMRIAARDLARLGKAEEIIREISDVADICLNSVLQICLDQLTKRHGCPWHRDAEERWQKTEFCVIGLGKLGGQELNYSSDVDVIFVYSEEGSVFKEPPAPNASTDRAMTSHQFYKKLAESFIAEVCRATSDGMLYRVDLRLRPEGDSGPLVRSLGSYETFYAQWGQAWERMMLIKARGIAGDASLAHEFLETVQFFRYPRSLSQGFLREIAAMKDRIETEVVKSGELERNVKLGRGGIREIEFITQTQQVLHAGRIPFLQGAQTLPALQKLVHYNLLPEEDAQKLAAAYAFLRDVEHRLQMEQNLQTHTIPKDTKSRERLAALMGFKTLRDFETAFTEHSGHVRQVYDKLLKTESPERKNEVYPRQFQGAEAQWKTILAEHRFRDPEKALRLLNEFAHGPGYVHVSPRTVELAWQLIPRLLGLCVERPAASAPSGETSPGVPAERRILSDPDRVLTRLDTFITAYGSRAMLFETWAQNPAYFELFLFVFDRSEFLAETAIRNPDLMDSLVVSGRLRRRKTAPEILHELREGRGDEDQRLWLRRYHQAEFMRIGLRDILGLADFEQNMAELTALADACLQYSLQVALRKAKLKKPPLVIIGLGKLGGCEINYGSDLDIIFVADPKVRNLPALQKIAVEIRDLLSSQTELGVAFATDARLRPDGEKGLLVNALDAYVDYYRRRAQLWELQAVSRCRAIAGDLALGQRFQDFVAVLTDFTPANVAEGFRFARKEEVGRVKSGKTKAAAMPSSPAAYSTHWKEEIHKMRMRIEKERTPKGQEPLAIKTGAGGLMDAEFIAQALCLAHGWHEPNTLRALERARDASALAPRDAASLIQNYRQLLRIEIILRRWSFVGEAVLPVEPAPYYRVSVRCGFGSPEAFREAVATCRKAIREVYTKFFGS